MGGCKCEEIILSSSKAMYFTRARVQDPLNYSLMGTLIPETNSCKYLRIILRSDLSWVDHVNYTVKRLGNPYIFHANTQEGK